MPLFRRKSEKFPKTSSLLLYGQGRAQTPPCSGEKFSDKKSLARFSPDERLQPFLAFAEVTFDPSLPMRHKSRLSKTLNEVLHDNAALAYFIQFMDSVRAQHIVKFWLEAESFHVSVSSRMQNHCDEEERQLPESHQLCPLLSSDSSGCVSERSDDIFQSSSRFENCRPSSSVGVNKTNGRYMSSDTGLDGMSVSTSQVTSHTSCCSETSHSDTSSDTSQAITSVTEDVDKVILKGVDDDSAISNKMHSTFGTSDTLHENASASHVNHTLSVNTHTANKLTNCVSSTSGNPVSEWGIEAEALNSEDGQEASKITLRLKTSVEQDAKAIYEKYITRAAPFPIGIGDELCDQISASIFQKDRKIEPECFYPAQTFVVKRMEEEFFPLFLRSSFHCKYQIDVLTSGNIYLADIMYNDSALFYFMEFMEQENVRHLLDFLLMADNFQKNLSSQEHYDGEQAQNDAMIIYDKYFSLQASSPLGFSDSIRYEVEQNICREGGPLPDCFLKPVRILTQYLEKTSLLQFLNSQLYFRYISECIITIQTGGANFVNPGKTSGSESGSESSSVPISSVNTLLAMDEKQPGASSKVLKNIEGQDMRIDTGHFKPDSLWQRPLAGKLQMARVDRLGRVITEFEPEPDRRRESRISKAVKKLVNRDDDKNQEDMAWQVAEMIVKDICSITMPESCDQIEENGPS